MPYPLEVSAALDILKKTKIWPSNYAPFLHRIFWRAGIAIPPPHFASFVWNFLFTGIWFGVIWGLTMWLIFWSKYGLSSIACIIGSALSGGFFGVVMSSYYRIRARQYNLPSWTEIKASM